MTTLPTIQAKNPFFNPAREMSPASRPVRIKLPVSTASRIRNGCNSGLLMKVAATVRGLLSFRATARPAAASNWKP